MSLTESTVEDAALSLFGKLGYVHHYGPYMAQSDPAAGWIHISVPNVSMHSRSVIAVGELRAGLVVKEFLTTAADGKCYATRGLAFAASEACA